MRLALVVCLALLAPVATASAQGFLGRLTGPRRAADLRSADPEARRRAAEDLGRYGDPTRAVAALTAALEAEREVTVRSAIVESLVRRGDSAAVPALVAALDSAGNLDAASIVFALGSFDDDRAARALVAALSREDLVEAASLALERMGPVAVPHLIRALDEPALAMPVARALGRIGDPRATPALVARLGAEREELRLAAVRALGELRDARAAPALAERLSDPSEEVVLDAIHALGTVGDPGFAPLVAGRIATGPASHRRAALTALHRLSPVSAIEAMERAVASGDPALARASIELALGTTHPRVVPLLFGLLREGSRAEEAASALAEVSGGAGVPVLARVAAEPASAPRTGPPERDPDVSDAASRALAIGLRKHAASIDDDLRERSLRALWHRRMPRPRAWLLRAIARDASVLPGLRDGLASDDPVLRATAARAIEVLGDPVIGPQLASALSREDNVEALRRLLTAATVLGVDVPISALHRHLASAETGPEAMAAAARSLPSYSARRREDLRRTLRAALRSDQDRVRAGAARALSIAQDREAWRALVVVLDDPAPEARLAAATALAELGVAAAAPAVLARLRIEEDPQIALALEDAATAPAARRAAPPELGRAPGREAVRVRIVARGEEGRGGVPVDVVVPDGRWLRLHTLPSGELVVVDLASGVVDVRVRVSE